MGRKLHYSIPKCYKHRRKQKPDISWRTLKQNIQNPSRPFGIRNDGYYSISILAKFFVAPIHCLTVLIHETNSSFRCEFVRLSSMQFTSNSFGRTKLFTAYPKITNSSTPHLKPTTITQISVPKWLSEVIVYPKI